MALRFGDAGFKVGFRRPIFFYLPGYFAASHHRRRIFIFVFWKMKDDLEKRITLLAEPLLREQGLEQVDLELSRQGSKLWIRFFVDRVAGGGVTVNECGEFNLAISRLLDVEDIVSGSYMLEVSSPGLDRRVRKVEDFVRFAGHSLTMSLREPVEGRKKLKGLIVSADALGVTVLVDGQELKVPHRSIARANLEYDEKGDRS